MAMRVDRSARARFHVFMGGKALPLSEWLIRERAALYRERPDWVEPLLESEERLGFHELGGDIGMGPVFCHNRPAYRAEPSGGEGDVGTRGAAHPAFERVLALLPTVEDRGKAQILSRLTQAHLQRLRGSDGEA
jgi:hypothetical protein